MKTLVTGCTGLVGSALVEGLFQRGHAIQCLKRNKMAGRGRRGSFWATNALPGSDQNFDLVVHLAGENVADGRWSAAKKERILASRVDGTRELVDFIASMPKKPKAVLIASAVGYYGSRGEEILDESSTTGSGFLADVCRQWEGESLRLTALGIRTVNMRFGMVLSPRGGALQKMIPPFRLGLGGVVGTGNQFISWISIRDLVAIIDFISQKETISGPVNVVSPIPTTNRELTHSLGKALGRRTLFTVPAFAVRLLFGQMADEMLLSSTRATPRVLLEAGYSFQDQSLAAVLRLCVKPPPDND